LRTSLNFEQQKLVERNWNGPVRVLGEAGTGKTVAAIHRAKWLAQNAFRGEKDRILFTIFTRNLAADIQDNLAKICPKDTLRKIEVINLDRWVSGFFKTQRLQLRDRFRQAHSTTLETGNGHDPGRFEA
jgi:superfamily I DNA/RNA helicase